MQTQKVTSFPIVLLGTEYWGGLVDWIRKTVLSGGKVSEKDVDLLQVTDSVEEAVAIMTRAETEHDRATGPGGQPAITPHRPD